jgi:hypothetical protein
MATYAELIDDFELEKRIRTIPEDMDLTEYIKQRGGVDYPEEKADGGSIGIEVLFGPKVPAAPSQLVEESEIVLGYRGDAAYRSGSEQSKSIGQGNVGSKASFGGGKGTDRSGRSEGISGVDRSKITEEQTKNQIKNQLGIKDPNLIQKTFNKYNSLPFGVKSAINTMAPVELMKLFNIGNVINTGINKIKNPVLTDEDMTLGATEEISFKGNSPFMRDQINERIIAAENEYLKQGKMPPEFLGDKIRMNMELGNYKGYMGPGFEDGGRVGLFMGGPALEGQALAIYNSMNTYGATDHQEIADRLSSLGLYTPGGTTTTPPAVPRKQISQGRGNDQDTTYVDRQDYSFNPANYAPGKQLEINPAAFGMSFEKASKPQGIINAALEMPGRTLTSFASPTTGGNITGPAEEGFMSQVVDIDPAGRTREQLRQQYDSYNRFFGAPSNFAAARTPGKAGQLINMGVGAISGIPFVGPALESLTTNRGDKSLRSKYTVDNVGFGNTGMRDEFGLFTGQRNDGFLGILGKPTGPDYVDRMNERLGELNDFFSSRIEGFDINNLDAETLDKMKDINGFYTKQIQAYKQRTAVENINKRTQDAIEAQKIQRELEEAAKAKDRAAALAAIKKQGKMDYNPNIHGPTDYGKDSQGNQSFDFGGGFGIGSDGGPVSNRTGRGRTGYSEGGLVTMFTRRR